MKIADSSRRTQQIASAQIISNSFRVCEDFAFRMVVHSFIRPFVRSLWFLWSLRIILLALLLLFGFRIYYCYSITADRTRLVRSMMYNFMVCLTMWLDVVAMCAGGDATGDAVAHLCIHHKTESFPTDIYFFILMFCTQQTYVGRCIVCIGIMATEHQFTEWMFRILYSIYCTSHSVTWVGVCAMCDEWLFDAIPLHYPLQLNAIVSLELCTRNELSMAYLMSKWTNLPSIPVRDGVQHLWENGIKSILITRTPTPNDLDNRLDFDQCFNRWFFFISPG